MPMIFSTTGPSASATSWKHKTSKFIHRAGLFHVMSGLDTGLIWIKKNNKNLARVLVTSGQSVMFNAVRLLHHMLAEVHWLQSNTT